MSPKVSIIVAVYNAEKTLRRCLDSLVNQELSDIEILLVDDGSTDRSGSICDAYAAEDSRIKVVHKQNEGVSATKQLGLDLATGAYFIFLDSDDYVDKSAYRKLYECAEKENADIACCDLYRIEPDGMKREGYLISSFEHEVFLNGIIDVLNGYMANRLIRRSLAEKYQIRFPQGLSFGEDKTFLVDLLSKSLKAGEKLSIGYLPEALIYYDTVINPNSLMKLDVKSKLDARLLLWETMGRNLDLDRFGKTYYRVLVKHGFTAFWNHHLAREEFESRFSSHVDGIRKYAPASSYTRLVLMASSGQWEWAQKLRWIAYGRIANEKLVLSLTNHRLRSRPSSLKHLVYSLFPGLEGQITLFKQYRYLERMRQHRIRVAAVRKAGNAKVLVVISNLAMWRLEGVVRLLKQDARFQVTLIVCPFKTFSPDDRESNVEAIVSYLRGLEWEYVYFDEEEKLSEFMHAFNPDLVFYPQLYSSLYGRGLNCEENLDRLITYVPYALPTTSGDWSYNSRYFNLAWRIYYPTEIHRQYARRHSYNHARNMVVVGDSHASAFLQEGHVYPWKGTGEKKRVIWAPHFSIRNEGHLHRTGFLWLHQAMWDIAVQFKDQIEFVFKPHPRLLSELYRHPDWGKERADAYYAMWKEGENTQLETGTYIDLFCTSDAMIHDCGSFSAEYHYTGKPVLFVSKDFGDVYRGIDDFGKFCLDLHYHAQSVEEIRTFLQDVVLDGKDPRKEERDDFRKKYLIPAEGYSFEQNVYHSLTRDLFMD